LSRASPPPYQGFMGTGTVRPPPRHRHRHCNMLLLHTSNKTSEASHVIPATNAACYANKQMASIQGAPVIRGSSVYIFLAIMAAKFFLLELHSVLGDKWGGRVRLTPKLRRDM
jgi:hypothetical protein